MTKPPFQAEPALSADEMLPEALEAELAAALFNAVNPGELDPELNEALIRDALEDPLRPATADELVESERLREALAHGSPHPDLELLDALQLRPGASTEDRAAEAASEAAALKALGLGSPGQHGASGRQGASPSTRARPVRGASNLIYVGFGVASAITLAAAAVMLLVFPVKEQPLAARPAAQPATQILSQSRSGSALFHEKFEHTGTTWRVDTIASARARELRSNRYKSWGLR